MRTCRPELLACLVLVACGTPRPDESVEDPRAYAIAHLVGDGRHCVADDPAYCLDDPAILAAVVDECAGRQPDEELPTTQRALDFFVRRCGSTYAEAQVGVAERRARVLEKIRERFENPPTYVDGARVWADHALVPSEIRRHRRQWRVVPGGDFMDASVLAAAAVTDRMLALQAAHPEAQVLVMRVQVPSFDTRNRAQFYVWYVTEGRIGVVRNHDQMLFPEPVDAQLAKLRASTNGFRTRMRHCRGENAPAECQRWWPTRALYENAVRAAGGATTGPER